MNSSLLRSRRFGTAFASLLLLAGCAWQRIPAPPQYEVEAPLPLKAGVALGDSGPSQTYGPAVVRELKDMKLFESLVFPYREGDPVDGVLRLEIAGGWKGDPAANFAKGFLIGLSFFVLSAAIGPSMSADHRVEAALLRSGTEVARCSARISTSVTWGLGANTTEVAAKSDALQQRKIAVEIAKRLCEQRDKVSRGFSAGRLSPGTP